MAASPKYKVYNEAGDYMASMKDANDAAVLLSVAHPNGSIRYGHSQVLARGNEISGMSYDAVAMLVHEREQAMHKNAYAKVLQVKQ